MIVNIRGTNGSGKSTLVRQLMERYQATPLGSPIVGYAMPSINTRVVGKYVTACGGCDTIKTQQESKDRVLEFSKLGNVVFEGVLISTIFGPWLEFSRQNGGMLWAFLDTPLQVCLERIQLRNGGKPVKEDQVKGKWETMRRVSEKAVSEGENVIWLDYRDALTGLIQSIDPSELRRAA